MFGIKDMQELSQIIILLPTAGLYLFYSILQL